MERNVEIDKISDGKRYGANDLVKVGCDDCRGCSACCNGMGDSIVLDPMDVYRLEKKLGKTMEEILLAGNVALRVVDGVILPHLKMTEQSDQCSFLNEEGRCSIHDARPGFCRMFPLGRLYEDGTFSYFLQVNECPKENKTKVKVSPLARYAGAWEIRSLYDRMALLSEEKAECGARKRGRCIPAADQHEHSEAVLSASV